MTLTTFGGNLTVADFLSRFDGVETDVDGYRVHCPAHDDSVASLRIAVSDKGKVLVKCRAGCKTEDVMSAVGLSMRDLINMKPGDIDVETATSTDVPASAADVARLGADLDRWASRAREGIAGSDAAYEYVEARFGLTREDAERLGIGYAPKASYDAEGNITNDGLPGGPRVVVPFRDKDGVPRGFQARAFEKDAKVRWYGPKSPEGASWSKVAWFEGGSGWDEVLITEGPGDSLTGVGIGYDTIGIRGAGLVSNEHVVAEVAEVLGDRMAVIAGDGDPSGRTFASRLAQALVSLGKRVKVLDVPDGLDLTDWRERDGAAFATNVVRAISTTDEVTSADALLRDRDEDRYPLTDLGNARFAADFIMARGSGVKYSPEAGFFLLQKGVWRPDKLARTRAYVQEAADLVARIADNLPDGIPQSPDARRKGRWKKWSQHSQSSRGIDAAMKELEALPSVATDVNDFDKHPDLLAVANGVIDLRTGELMAHDPSLLLTRRLEVEYDPHAKAERWEQFLNEVFPNHPDLPAFMQRLIGYGITGHTTEQTFAVFWGTGANGKSVFTDTLTEVFREFTTTTPFSTFEEKQSGGIPNDLAALKGSRLVMASEGEQGRPMAESVLKRVTGRDLIAARFMRKEFFEFRPSFLLMLATNFKPNFKGQDEGLWRRVKLIPWERFFAPHERDHRLGDKLLDERQGILAWAVRGAMVWYERGLEDPATITGATTEYRQTSDALAGFMPGVFLADPKAPGSVTGTVLFNEYLQWADEENLPGKERWTRRTFFGALEERGLVKRRTNKGVAFEGVRRSRPSDFTPEPAPLNDDSPKNFEDERVEGPGSALSKTNNNDTPLRGASVSDVL